MKRIKIIAILIVSFTALGLLILFLVNPYVIYYRTTPNGMLRSIDNVDFDISHISSVRYLESFTDDMTFNYETIDTNQSELLPLINRLIDDSSDFDLDFSTGIPVGGFPLIIITIQNDNEDYIWIEVYGDRDTQSNFNKIIIMYEKSTTMPSRGIELEITDDDFEYLYEFFYSE